jgi:hypothetical protein
MIAFSGTVPASMVLRDFTYHGDHTREIWKLAESPLNRV